MRTAKIFTHGRSQAVRLPKEYRCTSSDVYVKKVGGIVMLFPTDSGWQPLLDSLGRFSEDFMAERRQPEGQRRDGVEEA